MQRLFCLLFELLFRKSVFEFDLFWLRIQNEAISMCQFILVSQWLFWTILGNCSSRDCIVVEYRISVEATITLCEKLSQLGKQHKLSELIDMMYRLWAKAAQLTLLLGHTNTLRKFKTIPDQYEPVLSIAHFYRNRVPRNTFAFIHNKRFLTVECKFLQNFWMFSQKLKISKQRSFKWPQQRPETQFTLNLHDFHALGAT